MSDVSIQSKELRSPATPGLRSAVRWCLNGATVAALTAWAAFVVIRVPVLSHFKLVAGDLLDGMLAITIQMHWTHVLDGTAINWHTTDYFYPIQDTIGYNDGYFLHGLFLTLFRYLGADPFLSAQFSDWAFRAIGFASMWLLAARYIRWPFFIGLIAAGLFVTANCYYMHDTNHSQFLACYWLPLLIVLQLESFRAARRDSGIAFGFAAVGFAAVFGSILITAFYVSFFFSLADGLVLVIFAAIATRENAATSFAAAKRYASFAAVQIALLAVASIPFLEIYLPKARETGMHTTADMIPYALRPIDVVNVGQNNLLWSHFYEQTVGHFIPNWAGGFENETGATPILFVLFIFGGVALIRPEVKNWRRRFLISLWCTNVALLLLTIRWPHVWLWAHIYRFIPGAAGVRVISRIQLVLLIPTVLIACEFLARGWRIPQMRPVLVLLSCLLLAEQVNDSQLFLIDRAAQDAYFASIPRPPAECGFFFAENSRPGPDALTSYRHNVDSMYLAELTGLPTINGIATFVPPRWNLVHPDQPTYLPAVAKWIPDHPSSKTACGMDFQKRVWTNVPPRPIPPAAG